MKKPSAIQLSIPHPCTQKWDEMTPNDTGRFCGHCQKTVIDFTTWSDTALYDFFAKNTGKVCGRIFPEQLQRQINIPPQPHSRLYRLAVALGLTLLFGETQQTLAQTPLKTEQKPILRENHPANSGSTEMRGRVLDENKEPIMNANVQVYFKDILAGNAVTDPDGNFVVKPLNSGYYNACIIAPGYNKHLITQVAIEEQDSNKIHITLTRHKNSKPETVVTAYKKPFISADKPERILTKGEIAVIPTGGIQVDLVYISNVVYQTKRGDTVVLSKPDSAPPKTPANEPLNPSRKVYKGEDIDRLPH